LRKAGLTPLAVNLLREAKGADLPPDPARLAALIKALPLRLTAPAPLERAISTAGGVAFGMLDQTLALRSAPNLFIAGEMLDWEAPTGGYLLQASFATGAAAGRGAAEWMTSSDELSPDP
jgi:predicted flavoprotein YhiN